MEIEHVARAIYSIFKLIYYFKFQAESSIDFIQLESYIGKIDEPIETVHEEKLRHLVYLLKCTLFSNYFQLS